MASGYLKGTEMVKKKFIANKMKELSDGMIVTDKIFQSAPANGALSIVYQDNPTGLNDFEAADQVEERAELGTYPRIGMEADEKSAMIRDYGLDVLVSWKAVEYNQIRTIEKAFIKLNNSLKKFVDGLGIRKMTDNYNAGGNTALNTHAAGTAWGDAAAKPFHDLVEIKGQIEDHGYMANVAVMGTLAYRNAILNDAFRKEVNEGLAPTEKILQSGVLKGKVADLLIIQSPFMDPGYVWVGDSSVFGDRHEETNGIETDSYRDGNSKKAPYVASAFREFVDVVTDPKAGGLLSGV